jgi:hypothetical protein
VPVTNLRAAMILGSGSASFEMLRYLVDRLPMMITPRWVQTPCQPISIRNVLDYLRTLFGAGHHGPDPRHRRSGRPDLSRPDSDLRPGGRPAETPHHSGAGADPWLSAKWVHLVTPVPSSIAQPLAEG